MYKNSTISPSRYQFNFYKRLLSDYNIVFIGRIRNKRNADICPHVTDHILSLSLFPGRYVYPAIDDRYVSTNLT